jgi:thymidylate synthase
MPCGPLAARSESVRERLRYSDASIIRLNRYFRVPMINLQRPSPPWELTSRRPGDCVRVVAEPSARQIHSYPNFASAYRAVVSDVLRSGHPVAPVSEATSVGSHFGSAERRTIELLVHGFEIEDARSCLAFSPARQVSLPFCYGSLLWTMAGSDELAWITYYNERGAHFSDDGITLNGAFGKRMFDSENRVDQFALISERIRSDPATRRATAVIASPMDLLVSTRDFPCAIAVQFFVRANALHAIVWMRSQSALMVLPYDVFVFATLQSWLAAELGVDVGKYTHLAGSLHLYEDEISQAEEVHRGRLSSAAIAPYSNSPSTDKATLLTFEHLTRRYATTRDARALAALEDQCADGASFVGEAQLVLLSYAFAKLGWQDATQRTVARLRPEIATFLHSSLR